MDQRGLIDKIRHLETLEDGWDGYVAKAVHVESVRWSWFIAGALMSSGVDECSMNVTQTVSGSIEFQLRILPLLCLEVHPYKLRLYDETRDDASGVMSGYDSVEMNSLEVLGLLREALGRMALWSSGKGVA